MEELLLLRGVARKTANVVLGNCFAINAGVVVDTHVERLSHRLGLSRATTVQSIERDLMALFPREDWCLLSHLLIFHGRRSCKARGGGCSTDPICLEYCSEARMKKPCATTGKKVARGRGTSR
jgi:endonuclease-3